jgi:predicted RNase H-like HicB family nuclease
MFLLAERVRRNKGRRRDVAKNRGNLYFRPVQYHVKLTQSEEGWAVSCPSLPGCHSQGNTRDEALENIRIAITEWLQVEAEEQGVISVEEALVTI